jgi:inhibitor of cysteine peptidase
MHPLRPLLLTLPLLLTACAGGNAGGSTSHASPNSVLLKSQSKCPLNLERGQRLILRLPSNPSTGYRWTFQQAAPELLRSLGPEVYSHPDEANTMIGAEGTSTWRFEVIGQGGAPLALSYQRPWENEPADSFECHLQVR